MLKTIIILSFMIFIAHADMISFYKVALQTLQYEKSYKLYAKANKTSQSAITYSKYANLNADISYVKTYAQYLPTTSGRFNMTDIALHDTVDLFGKNNYKIEILRLDKKAKKDTLNLKKEKLFLALANMIALYNKTALQLNLQQELYHKQEIIFKKLEVLSKNGDITAMDVLRFRNTLTILQTKIASQKQELEKMKEQLHSFAPSKAIPSLMQNKILYTEQDFVAHNPRVKINIYDAKRLLATSKGLRNTYIPTIELAFDYQKLDDPTSYGDNHSFSAALHMPFNGGNFKEAESLKVAALSKKTQNIEYRIQRKNEYIKYFQAYQNAKTQLDILQKAYKDYEKSETIIKQAYLKQYVDFNTYLQVLNQALGVKTEIINMRIQKKLQATIINAIASGRIYE